MMKIRIVSGLAVAALTLASATTSTTSADAANAAEPNQANQADQGTPTSTGTWQVTAVDVDASGAGTWQASWTSADPLPMSSDRPTIVATAPAEHSDWTISAPTYADGGQQVVATVVTDQALDADDLDVVLSGRSLDDPATIDIAQAPVATTQALEQITDDPAAPGSFETVTSDYTLDSVKLPRMKEPIEMVGHVVEPTSASVTGPRPLVVFLHGRHSVCYNPADEDAYSEDWPCQAPFEEIPSHLGYDYIQQTLASQGFATVSIRVNGINAQDWRLPDGGADARAQIITEHLDHWTTIATDHQVDLSQVVLVGHSRGGEGVDRASLRIGLDAPYTIIGQVLIAPTNFGHQTAAYVPTVTLLPGCDGDVSDLQGQQYTDLARDLARDDTSLKSSVYIDGANHNYFNTEWTPGVAVAPANDDWWDQDEDGVCTPGNSTRLSDSDQRAAGDGYVTGAVRLFTGQQQWLPLFDGHPVTATSASARSAAVGGGRVLRRPGTTLRLGQSTNAAARLCRGITSASPAACGTTNSRFTAPSWGQTYDPTPTKKFWEMTWSQSGARASAVLTTPLDLSNADLVLRVMAPPSSGDIDFDVQLTDVDGSSATVGSPAHLAALPAIGPMTKVVDQALVVDPSGLDIDLSQITGITLSPNTVKGRIWVADAAAASDTVAAVPAKRLATLNIGSVSAPEGNGRRPVTVNLPVSVQGTIAAPARVQVAFSTPTQDRPQVYRIDLAPGQTTASVPVSWYPNRLADFPKKQVYLVGLVAVGGVMVDNYSGKAIRVDDDPPAKFRVKTGPKTVTEGEAITMTLTWRRRPAQTASADLIAVPVRGRAATTADLPKAWRKAHYVTMRDQAIAGRLYLSKQWRPTTTSITFAIPTLDDGKAEKPEKVKLRFRVWGVGTVKRTFTIVDR